jgi:hypothetical protein
MAENKPGKSWKPLAIAGFASPKEGQDSQVNIISITPPINYFKIKNRGLDKIQETRLGQLSRKQNPQV